MPSPAKKILWPILLRIIRAVLTIIANATLELTELKAAEKEAARDQRDNQH